MPDARTVVTAFALPWAAFVAVFLYYTLLTMVSIGVAGLPMSWICVTYLAPVVAYAAILAVRGIRALGRLPIELWHPPHAVLR